MDEPRANVPVEKRLMHFAKRIKTKIWHEQATADNPYVAEKCSIHGYDLNELANSISFTDSIYLNIRGELPSSEQQALLNAILVALSNLGPRHPATRAVMNAAVSKTQSRHLLPIGLSILSGEYAGAGEVESSVKFIRKNINTPAAHIAQKLSRQCTKDNDSNIITPGFGTCYGSVDTFANNLADQLSSYQAADRALRWGMEFSSHLKQQNAGWRLAGVAAACFVDLGFNPKASAGLFQLAAAPGLLAHGLEMLTKPLTAMPFVDDVDYQYLKTSHE